MSTPHSDIANAAIEKLKASHASHEGKLWAISRGRVIGDLAHTPLKTWENTEDPPEGHSHWFTAGMAQLIESTEEWCDFMTLTPPKDQELQFWESMSKPLATLAKRSKESGKKIVIRYLFGNVITMEVNVEAVMEILTKDIPDLESSNLQIYVGSWRWRQLNWNHSKIVAVDGKRLLTGGHNPWDFCYLFESPIHDTSIQLEGDITLPAHAYADNEWEYTQKNMDRWNWGVNKDMRITRKPASAPETVPKFASTVTKPEPPSSPNDIPILALGRYSNARGKSADDAFVAMFHAAKESIKLFLQDLGPMTVGGISPYGWPQQYFECWAKGMKERSVDIHIVLSNPGAGAHRGIEYSNGYPVEQVGAEIMKTMKIMYPDMTEAQLFEVCSNHLKVKFVKNKLGDVYETGHKVGIHSKIFYIDDKCTYIGSQNLYVSDLAEWGVLIDDKEQTSKFMDDLWNPAWSCTYDVTAGGVGIMGAVDTDTAAIMAIIDEDREPNHEKKLTNREVARMMTHLTDEDIKNNSCFDDDVHGCAAKSCECE